MLIGLSCRMGCRIQTLEHGEDRLSWWNSGPSICAFHHLYILSCDIWIWYHLVKRGIYCLKKKKLWKQLLNILPFFNKWYISIIWMQIFSIFTCYIRVYLVTRNRKPFFILILLKERNLLFYNWRKDRVVWTV